MVFGNCFFIVALHPLHFRRVLEQSADDVVQIALVLFDDQNIFRFLGHNPCRHFGLTAKRIYGDNSAT